MHHDNEHRNLALAPQLVRARAPIAVLRYDLVEQGAIADRDLAPVDSAQDTLASDRAKLAHAWNGKLTLLGAADDRCCQWMLARALEARSPAQDFILIDARFGDDGHEAWLAFSERARLVHYKHIDLLKCFERLRILD